METLVASSLMLLAIGLLYFFIQNILPGARRHFAELQGKQTLTVVLDRARAVIESSEKRGVSVNDSAPVSSILAGQPVLKYDTAGKKIWAKELQVLWLNGDSLRYRSYQESDLSAMGIILVDTGPTTLTQVQVAALESKSEGPILAKDVANFGITTSWKSTDNEPVVSIALEVSNEKKIISSELVLRATNGK